VCLSLRLNLVESIHQLALGLVCPVRAEHVIDKMVDAELKPCPGIRIHAILLQDYLRHALFYKLVVEGPMENKKRKLAKVTVQLGKNKEGRKQSRRYDT
jgi:hypothetical protein